MIIESCYHGIIYKPSTDFAATRGLFIFTVGANETNETSCTAGTSAECCSTRFLRIGMGGQSPMDSACMFVWATPCSGMLWLLVDFDLDFNAPY